MGFKSLGTVLPSLEVCDFTSGSFVRGWGFGPFSTSFSEGLISPLTAAFCGVSWRFGGGGLEGGSFLPSATPFSELPGGGGLGGRTLESLTPSLLMSVSSGSEVSFGSCTCSLVLRLGTGELLVLVGGVTVEVCCCEAAVDGSTL